MFNKKVLKVLSMSLVLVMTVAIFAACAKNPGQSTGSDKPAASTEKPDAGKKIKIGLSMDTLKEERWQRDRDLFIAKAEELGAEVIVQSANGDDNLQVSQAENLITQGVDILVVVPHNGEIAASIVDAAHKEGIKVIAYDRLIKNSDVDLYVSFDNVKVGELQAEYAVKQVPKGNYMLIGGAPTDNNAKLFREGQMNILQPLIDKGDIKIVGDQWAKDWQPEEALKHTENALTANNNKIDVVVASNDGTAGGAIQALAEQKLDGKVLVTGQDAELAAVQRIVEGKQAMTVYKPIKAIASKAAELAVAMAKGEKIETNNKVNNGKIDVPSVLLEPIQVDKNNMLDTVIKDGFHKLEDVYKNVPKDQWPQQK
ncbi:MAG: D-xylose transport system substrate-binding protein [Petroclostridium sp.]|nr:D-xylose ABC transporter substrate-binding protein [Petroclostridium xylanilyticum]MBZ4646598.1 periplasmic binding protein/LacI transcriptional regulator [Clostridia bacterium]MDK2809943.1 D-xylose transport system substrate-binding protein [Petroclostridium sp.]